MKEDLEFTDNDTSSAGMFFVGLICGAAIGAAVGMLLAPKTGAELRRQVATSADEWRRKATVAYDTASDVINDAIARGRDAIQVGRETFQHARPGNGSVDTSIS
jgi:gas vesicle protein